MLGWPGSRQRRPEPVEALTACARRCRPRDAARTRKPRALSSRPGPRRRTATDGLVLSYPLDENLVLSTYYRPPFARGFRRVFDAVLRFALKVVREFDIRTPSPRTRVSSLSGGNQQKAVVGREFSRALRLLVAAQPTRGVDVGSTEFIHRRILAARDGGAAVLLISAELDEILALSDRVAVLYHQGRLARCGKAAELTREEEIGLLMAGGQRPWLARSPEEVVDDERGRHTTSISGCVAPAPRIS